MFRSPKTTRIDLTRPILISIGDNVDMNMNFQVLTHDWASLVFREKYNDFVNSSGKVVIGNNIYFGTNCTILKGVSIGDNCIIGACSVVTKDVPPNSVAVGIPAKVICSLDDYYKNRKEQALQEAVEFVNVFKEKKGRYPFVNELREEFIYFVNKTNVSKYEDLGCPIGKQLASTYNDFLENHQSLFQSYEDFITYCESKK